MDEYTYASSGNSRPDKFYPVCIDNKVSYFSPEKEIVFDEVPENFFNFGDLIFEKVKESPIENFPINIRLEKIDIKSEDFEKEKNESNSLLVKANWSIPKVKVQIKNIKYKNILKKEKWKKTNTAKTPPKNKKIQEDFEKYMFPYFCPAEALSMILF